MPNQSVPTRPLSTLTVAAAAALITWSGIAGLGGSGGWPAAARLDAQSLQGSHESMQRQSMVAQQHGYDYLRTPADVMQAVDAGGLVQARGNQDYQLAGDEVSFPFCRPATLAFIEQLAHEYRAACGEPLVVTSLTRPITHQPWNASPISVHPTGMAVDMRRSERRACRQYLESTLLALEGEGMIEATREHWPAHYHVAVYPDPLLLPGPIGDPNGVARLAALHQSSWGTMRETDDEAVVRSAHVRVTRSSRTGRLRIAQGGAGAQVAVARHTGRIAVRRARRSHGAASRPAHQVVAATTRRHTAHHRQAVATAR
jgi:Family of unknown function (DUF5715)